MDFLNDLDDNTIIITTKSIKDEILNYLSSLNYLVNIKVIDITEFMKKMTFTYDEKAVYYLCDSLKIKPSIVKIYLDNLKYIENKEYKSSKLRKLKEIKDMLDQKNLLYYQPDYIDYLKYKNIVVYTNNDFTPLEKQKIADLQKITSLKIITKEYKNYNHSVFSFPTLEEEIKYVADKIALLLSDGIDINNIKITNLNKDYYNDLKRIFKLYKIPLKLCDNSSIYGNEIVKQFIANYDSSLNETFAKLKKYENTKIYQDLINICNKYYFVSDKLKVKDLIIEDIKNTNIKLAKYKNCVREVDYRTDYISDEDYVFMLNFNEGEIPKIFKDEDYITDNLKDEVLMPTTSEKNKQEKMNTINFIKDTKNLVITYKLKTFNKTFYKSSLLEELNLPEIKPSENDKLSYSRIYNELRLAKNLDNLLKFGSCKENVSLLYHNYPDIAYLKYDNKYTGIDKDNLLKYLNNNLVLSYSSLDNYYKCSFKYYLANILKLDTFNETFYTFIGNLFHYVLEKYYTEKIDIEEIIQEYITKNNIILNAKDTFFLNQLKEELFFVISTINNQLKDAHIKETLTEKRITIEKKYKNVTVTFKGFVDKILILDENEFNVVVLIDYKTGDQGIDLSLLDYGLSMQLPIYLYLVKNSDIQNIVFAGFYLQKILSNKELAEDNKTLEQIKTSNLKLMGYTNSNVNYLKNFEPNYSNSTFISGLKTTVNGEFYKSAKVISDENIEKLTKLVDEKIALASRNILNADFKINPKIVNNVNISCQFCNFKSVCYVKDKDKLIISKESMERGE